ncbi:MAG: hypothetical protein OIN66_07955 [Candidatus Methanoperedens sp.]|nr:hypothetical protein [Candidatus Methanoperedens sp.]
MLKNEGRFYLKDVVYSFEIDNYIDFFNDWVEKIKNTVGVHAIKEAEITVRDEYATAGWIMEELIKRSGFELDKVEYQEGFMATYVCTKIKK